MTALTADRNTKSRDGRQFAYPVKAATKCFAGGIACIDSTGHAVPGATSTTLKSVGVFQETADNSAGGNGDIKAEVRRGVFAFGNSASADQITRADIGSNCYVVDDATVAKTSGTNTRSIAGVVRDVDADGVWVEF